MSKSDNLGDFLDDLAEGIKAKKGISYAINPQNFRSEIESIETGGGGVVAEDSFYTIPTQYTIDRFDSDVVYDGKTCAQLQFVTEPEIVLPNDATQETTAFYWEHSPLGVNALIKAIIAPESGWGGANVSDFIFYVDDSGGHITHGMSIPLGGSRTINTEYQTTMGQCEFAVYVNGREMSMRNFPNKSGSSIVVGGGGNPTELLNATLNNTLTAIDSDVTSIVSYACYGLTALKTVNLPNLTSFGTYCFRGCSGLESVYAPNTKTVNTYSFYGCSKLTQIDMPDVQSAGNYAFYKCNLPSVNMPKLATIGQNTFYQNENLTIADFGVAKNIAQAGFANCYALEALILRKSDGICTLATATSALANTPIANGTGYVYVPKSQIETYKTATNWSGYAEQFRAIEDYPEITGG